MHVLATAGHVDHGKSTLVRALTGMEPDRFAEERRRGMTIDLGFAWMTLPAGEVVAFVDVPGHERFVTTMLAGIGPVPAVLLVVAADEGFMPQSVEHLDALAALGVRHGLLVISRSDLMDPALALEDARDHLAGTPLAGMSEVCVSAASGAGMAELRDALATLVAGLPAPSAAADVRLWVDRAFTIRGAGTVVTGTLGAGRIRVGDDLELLTTEGVRPVTVRGLHCLGQAVDEVRGVSRVAVNLRGVPLDAVARADVLLTRGAWLSTGLVDVRLRGVRGAAPDPRELPSQLQLHIGAAAVAARVRPLGPDTVRLQLRRPLPLRIGDTAVLRDPGRRSVIAGATTLDVAPPPLRRRGAAGRRAAELESLHGVPDAAAELARRRLARRVDLQAMGVPAADLDALAQAGIPAAAGWLLDPGHATALAAELASAVDAHDAADPLDPGLPLQAARRAVGLPEPRLVEAVLRHAGAAHGLALREGRVTRPTTQPPTAPLRDALAALHAELADHPFGAPEAGRLAELGLGPRELAALVKAGELLRLADDVVLLPGADAQALRVLGGLGPEFTLSAARQALGTSRRVAVPLLELLARTGRAARTADGNHRLLQ